jgi:diacylglycerol O-acyltransferase
MVPVNVRANGAAPQLGNRISLVPVSIPFDIRNPRKLLAAIHQRTQFLKNSHAAELIGFAGNLFGLTPSAIQALAGPIASALPVTVFNMVCTSIPGPEFPLYFLGHKMLTWYPYVPIGGEMALNCAILSYNGAVYFGFSGDANIVPDLTRLETFAKRSLAELQKSVRVELRPSKSRKPVGRKTAAKPKIAVAVRSPGKPTTSAPIAPVPAPMRFHVQKAEPEPALAAVAD